MTVCKKIAISKTETERYRAKVNFARTLEYPWRPGYIYVLNDAIRPKRPNGFEYSCQVAGQTGSSEPRWPKTNGATVTDGSVTWVAQGPTSNSSDTIASINLEVPTGITTGPATFDDYEVTFDIYGGQKGRVYEISVEVTTSINETFEEKLSVKITGE